MANMQNEVYVRCGTLVLILLFSCSVTAQEFKPYPSEKITTEQWTAYFNEVSESLSSTEQKHDEQLIITFSDPPNGLQFTFTMEGNPAHPAWITRQMIQKDGSMSISQTGYYAGNKSEYNRLYGAYEKLNEQIRLRIAAARQSVELFHWTTQEINYKFNDSDTIYDCRSLQKRIIKLLIAAGARDDVIVDIKNCPAFLPFSAMMTLYITLVTPAQENAGGEVFPARWEKVVFSTDDRTPPFIDQSDCDLLEDFTKELLPLFNARAVESKISCMRGGRGSIHLEYEILKPHAD